MNRTVRRRDVRRPKRQNTTRFAGRHQRSVHSFVCDALKPLRRPRLLAQATAQHLDALTCKVSGRSVNSMPVPAACCVYAVVRLSFVRFF